MKQRSMRLTLLSVLILMGIVACATQQEPPAPTKAPEVSAEMAPVSGEIRGTVTDALTGDSLGYANLRLYPASQPRTLRGTMTGAEGTYAFRGLGLGSYRVEVILPGYVGQDSVLALRRHALVAELDFNLRPAAEPSMTRREERKIDGSSVNLKPSDPDATAALDLEDLTGYAVDEVEEAVDRQTGIVARKGELFVRGGRSGANYSRLPGVAAPEAATDEASPWEDLVSGRADELWVIQRPAGGPVDGGDLPGSGCLMATVQDEEVPVPLQHTDVQARITGYIASVEVLQRFHNPFEETIEAEYVFPLPHDAAVNDFLMVVGKRRIRGVIREKEEAREIYEEARRRGHVASLLEQQRPNIFRQKVANIEPAKAIDVELHYFNALPYVDDHFEFTFPLVVGPRFNPPAFDDAIRPIARGTQNTGTGGTNVEYLAPNERSGHDVAITVELDAGVSLEDLESANHAVRIERRGTREARVELAPFDRIPNKDFVLRYQVAGSEVKSEILVHRQGEEGFFSMMLVPPADLENLRRAPVEFVFVLDCSGSMSGWPMAQAKGAMRRALHQLRPSDSFQIVRFSDQASALGPGPLDATEENIRRGLEYVHRLRGSGGTMMIEGIKAALDFRHDPERMRVVSFMTDGYIGNEEEIFATVAERLGQTRIFSFGVGKSVNRHLVEGLARLGKGAVAYIGQGDDLAAVDGFYRRVRHPALTDIEIDWGPMEVAQVYPKRLPDLFVGRPVLIHGRYQGNGERRIRVRGRAGARTVSFEVDVDLDDRRERPALPLLWARSEIQHIGDRLARESNEELVTFGTELALNFNLMSRWTSFVAVDASEIVDEPGRRHETVPVPVPEGVRYETTVGGGR